MAKFRSRPVEIEAKQFWGSGDHPAVEAAFGVPGSPPSYCVKGRQGYSTVNPGDWIISEPNDAGFYPCAPDVFAAKYEEV